MGDLFGIYLHWPFCARICPYCDFNVYAAKSRDPEPVVQALQTDLARQAAQTTGQKLTSVYFGGGTPSLIPPGQITALTNDILTYWDTVSEPEITLEANPEDVDHEKLLAWRDAGINRISLGIQALDDPALRFLGRAHTRAEAEKAIDLALSVFENVSIDMIYARPGQSIENWLGELDLALAKGAPHLSLYELTIKEKTAFQKQVERKNFVPLSDDDQADLYIETLRLTAQRGMPAYEVSNHARSEAYWSRHNLTYWLGGDWLGIGPGAEGRLTLHDERIMTRGKNKPADYITDLLNGGTGMADIQTLTEESDAKERLIMGLRSVLGVEQALLETLFGQKLDLQKIESFKDSGHLREEDDRLILTQNGWLLADYIARSLSP